MFILSRKQQAFAVCIRDVRPASPHSKALDWRQRTWMRIGATTSSPAASSHRHAALCADYDCNKICSFSYLSSNKNCNLFAFDENTGFGVKLPKFKARPPFYVRQWSSFNMSWVSVPSSKKWGFHTIIMLWKLNVLFQVCSTVPIPL